MRRIKSFVKKTYEHSEKSLKEYLEQQQRMDEERKIELGKIKKYWIGPYEDSRYTWGKLSGSRFIDGILALTSCSTSFLFYKILTETARVL